jgi:DNA-binding GntR family transcriptional regulator
MRGVLEGLAARITVEQKLPIAELEATMLEFRRAVEANDVRAVIDRVQRFHVCLLEKPGNPFLRESGLRLIVPLYAFTLMRALAKNLDAGPWALQIANHQRIVDAIRMGNPQLAEQVVIHVTNLFMERALEEWAH